MKDLLLDMKAEVERAKALGQHELDVLVLARLLRRYDELLAEGYQANPLPQHRGSRNLRSAHQGEPNKVLLAICWIDSSSGKWAVLRFLHDFAVPFDNNQAARDLRMVKVQQKISGTFRSDAGATTFCRIRSYLSTMRKQGHGMLVALAAVFAGQPLPLAWSPV